MGRKEYLFQICTSLQLILKGKCPIMKYCWVLFPECFASFLFDILTAINSYSRHLSCFGRVCGSGATLKIVSWLQAFVD